MKEGTKELTFNWRSCRRAPMDGWCSINDMYFHRAGGRVVRLRRWQIGRAMDCGPGGGRALACGQGGRWRPGGRLYVFGRRGRDMCLLRAPGGGDGGCLWPAWAQPAGMEGAAALMEVGGGGDGGCVLR